MASGGQIRSCRDCGDPVAKSKRVCDPCRNAIETARAKRRWAQRPNPSGRTRRPNGSPPLPRRETPPDLVREYGRRRAEREGRVYVPLEARKRALAERREAAAQARRERAAAAQRERQERIRLKPWTDQSLGTGERFALRYRLDPDFCLKQRLRAAFRRKRQRLKVGDLLRSALARQGRSPSIEAFVGYIVPDLRRHLERQFAPGMDWPRFCAGEIHIDHIVPLAEFDLSDPAELKAAWALPNLRPAWERDNIAKGAKRLTLL